MATVRSQTYEPMSAGRDSLLQAATVIVLGHALMWGFLLVRWTTFGYFQWTPFSAELVLAGLPGLLPYLIYVSGIIVDLTVGLGLLKETAWARQLGIVRSVVMILLALAYFWFSREFFGAALLLAVAGMMLVLLLRHAAWSLAYPAAFWLLIFFIVPMLIVLVVSFGERARLGTITYPALSIGNVGVFFNDYARFFSTIGGEFIYLRIFGRSVGIAVVNTLLCLVLGYPFAYWIARRPERYRGPLIFLVMIPFWTNFLVRTYAWMLILRDSGFINNLWTVTFHEQALALADNSQLFAWLASISEAKLPLLFNQRAVMIGLLYGYFPFMVLPLYSNLEKLDWSLLEAAADLGANTLQSTIRVLLPLSMPGIVAGSIIVFIPTLGAYVTPDLLGGAKVALLGNLLQQQFMTVRDWPFGSAVGFIMMAIMLAATLIYFRIEGRNRSLAE